MYTYQTIPSTKLEPIKSQLTLISIEAPAAASISVSKEDLRSSVDVFRCVSTRDQTQRFIYMTAHDMLLSCTEWKDKAYRAAYAEAAVEQGIAWQIKVNRERRGMTQKQLAQAIGTRQSSVSRMEDPEYGKHSLKQLQKIADVFDCALLVKFAAFSILARERESLSPDELFVPSYESELGG